MACVPGWSAVVDGSQQGLPDVPLRLIKRGRINKTPGGRDVRVLLGTNTDEFALFAVMLPLTMPHIKLPLSDQDLSTVSTYIANYHQRWNLTNAAQITALYNSTDFHHSAARITALVTDLLFRCGTRRAAAALGNAQIETYLYQFDYHDNNYANPDSARCQVTQEAGCGVHHGDEVPYVFGHKGGLLHPEAQRVSDMMGGLWTNFSRGLPPSFRWPRYNASEDTLMRLNAKPTAESHSQPRCDFWDSLPPERPYLHDWESARSKGANV